MALTQRMREIQAEKKRRLDERGSLTDTSLLRPFEGFWPVLARVQKRLEEVSNVPTQELAMLNKPFDRGIIEQKSGFDYIPHPYVTERLNQALGVDGWSFEIKSTEVIKELDTIVVLGRLTAHIGDQIVLKEQYGGQTINRKKRLQDGTPGDIVDISNDFKGAASDALKKCATLLGVGEELYMQGHKPPQNEQGGQGGQSSGQPAGQPRTGNPASQKQIELILDERKKRQNGWESIQKVLNTKGMPSLEGKEKEEAAATATEYLSKLSSKEASDLITALKALPFKSQQQTA